MRIITFFICFIIISITDLYPQDWLWQNPLPQGLNLNSVFFVDDSTGWAVGGSLTMDFGLNPIMSAVLKTTDCGASWVELKNFILSDLTSLYFISRNTGWAVGSYGTIIKTTDGGNSWVHQANPLGVKMKQFIAVKFTSEQTGWAVSESEILKTTDGGNNWFYQVNPIADSSIKFRSASFPSESVGYIVGDKGTILVTTDGGNFWSVKKSPVTNTFYSTYFISENTGWISGGDDIIPHPTIKGIILRTTDSGDTWNYYENDSAIMTSIHFKNIHEGCSVSSNGIMLITLDGGISWVNMNNSIPGKLKSVFFNSEDKICAIGYETLIQARHEQNYWDIKLAGTMTMFYSCFFISPFQGWVVGGNGTILKTTDGGSHWIKKESNISLAHESELSSVFFISQDTGWVTGNILLKTTDGGENWKSFNIRFSFIQFVSPSIGWGISNSSVIKTTDGGNTWIAQNTGDKNNVYSVYFINKNIGFVTGWGGLIMKTTDGGNTWAKKISNESGNILRSVFFVSDSLGWAVGTYGVILKTSDAGETWTKCKSGTYTNLHSVFFASKNEGWITGSSGLILKTIDGGIKWGELKKIEAAVWTSSLFFVSPSVGWAVGSQGAILKTTNGGGDFITSINNDPSPEYFNLLQNYPNPFNPATTINYSLASDEKVKLKVYDILGREVAELINEIKSAGKHTVKFNAGNLASGIYFYSISAGKFNKTNKMILAK